MPAKRILLWVFPIIFVVVFITLFLWERVTPKGQTTDFHGSVHVFAVGEDGNPWVRVMKVGGVTIYNPHEKTTENIASEWSDLASNDINFIVLDDQDLAWIAYASPGLGFSIYDRNDWEFLSPNRKVPVGNQVNCITFAQDGTAWIGTNRGVATYHGETWEIISPSELNLQYIEILSLNIDAQNRVWIGTRHGLAVYDQVKWKTFTDKASDLPGNVINAIEFGENGQAWIATDAGIGVYDGSQWTVLNKENSGLRSNDVATIKFDNQNRAWVLDSAGILSITDGEHWDYFVHEGEDWAANNISSFALNLNGELWIGTDNEGMIHHFTDEYHLGQEKQSPPSPIVRSTRLFLTNGGYLYLALLLGSIWVAVWRAAERGIGIGILIGLVAFVVFGSNMSLGGDSIFINPGIVVTIGGILGGLIGNERSRESKKALDIYFAIGGAILGFCMGICIIFPIFLMQ